MYRKSQHIYSEANIKSFFVYKKIEDYLKDHQKNLLELSRQKPDISRFLKQKFKNSCSDSNQIYEILLQKKYINDQVMLKHILNLKYAILNGDDNLKTCQLLKILQKENSKEVNSEILYCLGYLLERMKKNESSSDSEKKEIAAVIENIKCDVSQKALNFVEGLLFRQQNKDSFIDYEKNQLKMKKINNNFQPQKCQQMVKANQNEFNQEFMQIQDIHLTDLIKRQSKKTCISVNSYNQPEIIESDGSDNCWHDGTYTSIKKIYDKIQENKDKIIKKEDIDNYLPSKFLSGKYFSGQLVGNMITDMMIAEIFGLAVKQKFQPKVIKLLSNCLDNNFQNYYPSQITDKLYYQFLSSWIPPESQSFNSRLDGSCKYLIFENSKLDQGNTISQLFQSQQLIDISNLISKQEYSQDGILKLALTLKNILYFEGLLNKLEQHSITKILDNIQSCIQKNKEKQDIVQELIEVIIKFQTKGLPQKTISFFFDICDQLLIDQQVLLLLIIKEYSDKMKYSEKQLEQIARKINDCRIYYYDEEDNRYKVDKQKRHQNRRSISQIIGEIYEKQLENKVEPSQYTIQQIFNGLKEQKKQNPIARILFARCLFLFTQNQGILNNIIMDQILEDLNKDYHDVTIYSQMSFIYSLSNQIKRKQQNPYCFQTSQLKQVFKQKEYIINGINDDFTHDRNINSLLVVCNQFNNQFDQDIIEILLLIVEQEEENESPQHAMEKIIKMTSQECRLSQDFILQIEKHLEKPLLQKQALLILQNVIEFKQKVSENVLKIFINEFFEQDSNINKIQDMFNKLDKYTEDNEISDDIFIQIEIQRACLQVIYKKYLIEDECSYILEKANQGFEIPPYVFNIFEKHLDYDVVLKCVLQALKNKQNLLQSLTEKLCKMLNPNNPKQLILEIFEQYCKNNSNIPHYLIQKSFQISNFSDSVLNLFCEMSQQQITLKDEIILQMCQKYKSNQTYNKYQFTLLSAIVNQIPKKQDLQISGRKIQQGNQKNIEVLQSIKQVLELSIQQDNHKIIEDTLLGIEKLLEINPQMIDDQIINNLIKKLSDQIYTNRIISILNQQKLNQQQKEQLNISIQVEKMSDNQFIEYITQKQQVKLQEYHFQRIENIINKKQDSSIVQKLISYFTQLKYKQNITKYGQKPTFDQLVVAVITYEVFEDLKNNLDEDQKENQKKLKQLDLQEGQEKEEDEEFKGNYDDESYEEEEVEEENDEQEEEEFEQDDEEEELDDDDDDDDDEQNEIEIQDQEDDQQLDQEDKDGLFSSWNKLLIMISPNFYYGLIIILQNPIDKWVEKVNEEAMSKNFFGQKKKNVQQIVQEFRKVLNYDQQFQNGLCQQIEVITQLFDERKKNFNLKDWLKGIKSKDNENYLNDTLSAIMYATYSCFNITFTHSQILACIILYQNKDNQNAGIILQVFTGEGKSTIVSAIAILEAIKGIRVDIVTSNMVLAMRDAQQKQNLYRKFNLTCSHNGDTQNYQQGEKECYKNDIVYGEASQFQFDTLHDQYHQHNTLGDRKKKNRVVIIDEVDSMLIDDSSRISKLTSTIPLMDSFQLIYLKIWKLVDSIQNKVQEQNQMLANQDDLEIFKQEDIKGQNMVNLQNTIRDEIIGFVVEDIIKIPINLKEFFENQLKKWIENAFRALHLKKNIDYIVKNGKIMPVEFNTTGVILSNTNWNDGLHQFLQIKENVELSLESLTTNFLSNVQYFKQYSYIFGLTGTLGSNKSKEVLKLVYNTKLAIIPSFYYKQFINLGTKILPNRREWINTIILRVKSEQKKCRGTLIICESINDAHEISQGLKNILGENKIKEYTENDDNQEHHIQKINEKEVIVATNLAGRGTDINTESIEKYGGLHVLITFLPMNQRVEEQAMGRTSRQGKCGTGEIIICDSQQSYVLANQYNIDVSELLKQERDQNEINQIDSFLKCDYQIIQKKDQLFKKFTKEQIEIKIQLGNKSNLIMTIYRTLRNLANIKSMQNFISSNYFAGIEEKWARFLYKIDNNIIQMEQIETEFEQFLKQVKDNINDDKNFQNLIDNPSYFIQIGNYIFVHKLYEGLSKEQSLECFKNACDLDKYSIPALLGLAVVKTLKDQITKEDLLKDLQQIINELDKQINFVQSKLSLIDTQNNLNMQFQSQLIILKVYQNYIQQAYKTVKLSLRYLDVRIRYNQQKPRQIQEQIFVQKDIKQLQDIKCFQRNFSSFEIAFNGLTSHIDMVTKDQALNIINKSKIQQSCIFIESVKLKQLYQGFNSIDYKQLTQQQALEQLKKEKNSFFNVFSREKIVELKEYNHNNHNEINCQQRLKIKNAIQYIKNQQRKDFRFDLFIQSGKNDIDEYQLSVEIKQLQPLDVIFFVDQSKCESFSIEIMDIDMFLSKLIQILSANNYNYKNKQCFEISELRKSIIHIFDKIQTLNFLQVITNNIEQNEEKQEIYNLKITQLNSSQIKDFIQQFTDDKIAFNLKLERFKHIQYLDFTGDVSITFHDLSQNQCEKVIPQLRKQNILFQLLIQTDKIQIFEDMFKLYESEIKSQKILLKDTKQLKDILTDQEKKEFKAFNDNGFQFVPVFYEQKPFPYFSFILVLCTTIIQLSLGIALLCTPGAQGWGLSILLEGIFDFYTLYKIYSDREFGWKQYFLQKGLAYTIIAVTYGIKAIKAKKALNKVKGTEGTQIVQSTYIKQAESVAESTAVAQTTQKLNEKGLTKVDKVLSFRNVVSITLPPIIYLLQDYVLSLLEEKLQKKIEEIFTKQLKENQFINKQFKKVIILNQIGQPYKNYFDNLDEIMDEALGLYNKLNQLKSFADNIIQCLETNKHISTAIQLVSSIIQFYSLYDIITTFTDCLAQKIQSKFTLDFIFKKEAKLQYQDILKIVNIMIEKNFIIQTNENNFICQNLNSYKINKINYQECFDKKITDTFMQQKKNDEEINKQIYNEECKNLKKFCKLYNDKTINVFVVEEVQSEKSDYSENEDGQANTVNQITDPQLQEFVKKSSEKLSSLIISTLKEQTQMLLSRYAMPTIQKKLEQNNTNKITEHIKPKNQAQKEKQNIQWLKKQLKGSFEDVLMLIDKTQKFPLDGCGKFKTHQFLAKFSDQLKDKNKKEIFKHIGNIAIKNCLLNIAISFEQNDYGFCLEQIVLLLEQVRFLINNLKKKS
ncbi:hypothetical protein ABPG72_006428 [Tetrahymena utriculariae]